MIETFRVQNYKALRDVTLSLTPIHVLIGPNDSGKTSILEALSAALCRTAASANAEAFEGRWDGLDLVWNRDDSAQVVFDTVISRDNLLLNYQTTFRFRDTGRQIVGSGGTIIDARTKKR